MHEEKTSKTPAFLKREKKEKGIDKVKSWN